MADRRLELLTELKTATKEYVLKERTRLQNEVLVMESILNGRTGGRGIQKVNTQAAAKVATASLASYLGKK